MKTPKVMKKTTVIILLVSFFTSLNAQIKIDIAKYKTHPNCKILYCFVYDPDGYVNNPKGIENDLNNDKSDMKVKVKIVPKGH